MFRGCSRPLASSIEKAHRGIDERQRRQKGRHAKHAVSGARLTCVDRFQARNSPLNHRGLQNRAEVLLLVRMKQNAERIRKDVAAHRARQAAAGRVALNTYVPGDLIEAIDRIKEQKGVPGRAPIIEEALRFYIENAPRA